MYVDPSISSSRSGGIAKNRESRIGGYIATFFDRERGSIVDGRKAELEEDGERRREGWEEYVQQLQ